MGCTAFASTCPCTTVPLYRTVPTIIAQSHDCGLYRLLAMLFTQGKNLARPSRQAFGHANTKGKTNLRRQSDDYGTYDIPGNVGQSRRTCSRPGGIDAARRRL